MIKVGSPRSAIDTERVVAMTFHPAEPLWFVSYEDLDEDTGKPVFLYLEVRGGPEGRVTRAERLETCRAATLRFLRGAAEAGLNLDVPVWDEVTDV
jgi:hypothetical protein